MLEEDCQVWLDGVELSLQEFSESDLLADKNSALRRRVGSSGNQKEPFWNPGWIKNLPFSKKPSVSFLQPKDVVNIDDTTGLLARSAGCHADGAGQSGTGSGRRGKSSFQHAAPGGENDAELDYEIRIRYEYTNLYISSDS